MADGDIDQANAGGAANELGSQYRAEIAAWIVAHGLAELPIPGLAGLVVHGVPELVALESDRLPDDIVVVTRSSQELRIQAKRNLSLSKRKSGDFRKVVSQLIAGANAMRHSNSNGLLVIATTPTGPTQDLSSALLKRRAAVTAPLTHGEQTSFSLLVDLLVEMDSAIAEDVCLRTEFLMFSHDGSTTYRDSAIAHLESAVVARGHGEHAFERLMAVARTLATRRIGWELDMWLDDLNTFGIPLRSVSDGTTAERRHATAHAVRRYFDALCTSASTLDLRLLGIPLAPMAAEIITGLNVEGATGKHLDICEAVRRYGRVVLVGLPGSGKSTALLNLAAREFEGRSSAFPLRVQLSKLKADLCDLDTRLLDLALDETPVDDRLLLREKARREIARGRAIWLLDGLDECVGWHLQLVASLDRWLKTAVADCDVVITTRDVAFASARTLGWPSLRLERPRGLEQTVTSLARHYAATVGLSDGAAWADRRTREIRELLERESDFVETPLVVLLLTYHACIQATGLPKTRGRILRAVVDDFVRRWEHPRSQLLGNLTRHQAPSVLVDAFVVLGRTVTSMTGVRVELVDQALRDMLSARWGMPIGPASATAEAIRDVWDQAGFFPASGAPRYVTARLRTFLDLAQALAAIAGSPPERAALFEAERDDVLQLAASLDAGIARDVLERALETKNGAQLAIAADAQLEWQDADAIVSIVTCLLSRPWEQPQASGILGIQSNFPDWLTIRKCVENPVASVIADDLRKAIRKLPDPARSVATALLEEGLGDDVRLGVALDAIIGLDAQQFSRHGVWKVGLELVSRHLLASRPELAPLLARHASSAIERQLLQLGHTKLFEYRDDMWKKHMEGDDGFRSFFTQLAMLQDSSATWRQRRQLAELATLFQAITPGDASRIHASNATYLAQQGFSEILETCLLLIPSESGVIGDQAAVVLEHLEESRRGIIASLWELGRARTPGCWPGKVPERVLRRKLVTWLGQGRWRRIIAARALESGPNGQRIVEDLGRVMGRLPVPARVNAVAIMCHHANDYTEIACVLSTALDPVVRGEGGAHLAYAYRTAHASCRPAIERLLADIDLGVRSRVAVNLGALFWGSEFEDARNLALGKPANTWTCLHCGSIQTRPVNYDPRTRRTHDLSCAHCHVIGIVWPQSIESES